MLSRVHIANVRSCEDVTLDNLGRITALVGRNGAGKTNVMRAIDSTARTAVDPKGFQGFELTDLLPPRANISSVELEFAIDGGTRYKYSQSFRVIPVTQVKSGEGPSLRLNFQERLDIYTKNAWQPILSREDSTIQLANRIGEFQVGGTAPALPAITSVLPPDDPLLRTIQPIVQFLSSIHYYPLDELNVLSPGDAQGFIKHTDYAQWQLEQSRSADPTSSVLMRLVHMSQQAPDDFSELKELVGPNGLGVLKDIKVQNFRIPGGPNKSANIPADDKSDVYYVVQFIPNHAGDIFRTYSAISFGTRRLLRILSSLLNDKNAAMLIEQPEDGIHPGLLHKLIPLLKTYSQTGQVILASHSPAVFNRLTPDEVRLVDMRDGTTRLRRLTPSEISGAKRFISEEGPLSDFLESIEGGT